MNKESGPTAEATIETALKPARLIKLYNLLEHCANNFNHYMQTCLFSMYLSRGLGLNLISFCALYKKSTWVFTFNQVFMVSLQFEAGLFLN